MKNIIILLLSISLHATDVCSLYQPFIEAQSKTIREDGRRSEILLRVIELAFDDCYEDVSLKQREWYRKKYIQVWGYNERAKQKKELK